MRQTPQVAAFSSFSTLLESACKREYEIESFKEIFWIFNHAKWTSTKFSRPWNKSLFGKFLSLEIFQHWKWNTWNSGRCSKKKPFVRQTPILLENVRNLYLSQSEVRSEFRPQSNRNRNRNNRKSPTAKYFWTIILKNFRNDSSDSVYG